MRALWPGQDPVGKSLAWSPTESIVGGTGPLVVGVARDLKTTSGAAPAPVVYVPLRRHYESTVSVLARARDGQRALADIRVLLAAMNPNLPVVASRHLDDSSSPVLLQLRVAAFVSATVGLVGLLLAATGVYAVTAFTVACRTREIGVRIAMGARSSDVLRMILGQGMSLVAAGSAVGLLLAAMAERMLRGFLFGVPALDPITFGGAAVLFAVVGLAACYAPARRATRIDAMEALRCE